MGWSKYVTISFSMSWDPEDITRRTEVRDAIERKLQALIQRYDTNDNDDFFNQTSILNGLEGAMLRHIFVRPLAYVVDAHLKDDLIVDLAQDRLSTREVPPIALQ